MGVRHLGTPDETLGARMNVPKRYPAFAHKHPGVSPNRQRVRFALGALLAERHRWAVRLLAVHSMTSSARSKNDSWIIKPSTFAVIRFITRLNLVGCSTGKSPGLEPWKILFTSRALS